MRDDKHVTTTLVLAVVDAIGKVRKNGGTPTEVRVNPKDARDAGWFREFAAVHVAGLPVLMDPDCPPGEVFVL